MWINKTKIMRKQNVLLESKIQRYVPTLRQTALTLQGYSLSAEYYTHVWEYYR